MRDTAALAAALGREVPDSRELTVDAAGLPTLLRTLKDLGEFVLMDIDAVDRPEAFEVCYRLLDRGGSGAVGILTVRTTADKADPRVPSVMGTWRSADVMEREVWDLMGIRFEGRDGLTRVLCPDDFEGHPLRKDFALKPPERFAPETGGGAR